jgi:hypothetical protein
MVYLGGPIVLLDRFLLVQYSAKQASGEPQLLFPSAGRHQA